MFSYTDKEFLVAYKNIKNELILEINPVKNPKAYLLGGQPGAGKSSLTGIISQKESGNIIVINKVSYFGLCITVSDGKSFLSF